MIRRLCRTTAFRKGRARGAAEETQNARRETRQVGPALTQTAFAVERWDTDYSFSTPLGGHCPAAVKIVIVPPARLKSSSIGLITRGADLDWANQRCMISAMAAVRRFGFSGSFLLSVGVVPCVIVGRDGTLGASHSLNCSW